MDERNKQQIVFVGATRNFFKVGHRTIHHLSATRPDVSLMLAVPDPAGAEVACRGATNVRLVGWEPAAATCPVESLTRIFHGAHSVLLVPPVHRRREVAEAYIRAAQLARVERLVCIGVQHVNNLRLQLSREAGEVSHLLATSGIEAYTLHLPLFLENFLYQADLIKAKQIFRFPCRPQSRFAYVACADLAPIVGNLLLGGDDGRQQKSASRHQSLRLSADDSGSCEEFAVLLSYAIGRTITFETCSDQIFLDSLMHDGGSASAIGAARGILELWREIDAGRDMVPTGHLKQLLGRAPMSLERWVQEHACCFTANALCNHPQPPPTHSAPQPEQEHSPACKAIF